MLSNPDKPDMGSGGGGAGIFLGRVRDGGGGRGGEGGSVLKGVGAEEVQIYFEGKLNANFKITFYVD